MRIRKSPKAQAVDQARSAFRAVEKSLVDHQRYKKSGMLRSLPRWDIFYQLPLPGGGFEIIGRQGFKALKQAAEALLTYQPNMRGRLAEKEVVDVLKKVLAREIFVRQRAIDDADAADKLLTLSVRHIRRYHLRTVTHILPCIAPNAKNHTFVKIGPVELLPVNVFLQKNEGAIEDARTQVEDGWLKSERLRKAGRLSDETLDATNRWPRKAIRDASVRWTDDFRSILSTYPWVAIVEVISCAPKMSRERAQLAVETALNALRLVFGTTHAYSMRRGGGFRLEARTTSATIAPTGQLYIAYSQTWESAGLSNDWTEHLLDSEVAPLIESLGNLITHVSAGGVLPPLHQRVVDSLAWYGEAVAEPQPHTRLLRCMASLERLLVTPGQGRKEEMVRRRAVLLCSAGDSRKQQYWRQRISRVYHVRHGVVHGDLSPFDQEVLQVSAIVAEVTQKCLWSGIYWTAYMANRNPIMSAGELNAWYDRELESFCADQDTPPP